MENKEEVKEEVKMTEEELLSIYMDGSKEEILTDEDRKDYWKRCHDEVKKTYKNLCLMREDVDGMPKNRQDETKNQLVDGFRKNRQDRKRAVTELRKLGEKVDDPFVPFSAV